MESIQVESEGMPDILKENSGYEKKKTKKKRKKRNSSCFCLLPSKNSKVVELKGKFKGNDFIL